MTGLVSAVIPVRNGIRYLGEAISTVLEQTHPRVEVIVVDDGSTDDSAGLARSFPGVRVCSQPPSGLGAARNRGVELSEGDHIAFLDADDLWEPTKLERQLEPFELAPPPDLVWGHVIQFVSPDLGPQARRRFVFADTPQPAYFAAGMLLTRETFWRVGPFVTHLRAGEFVDWMARARELGLRELLLPDLVLRRRIHESNGGIVDPSRGDYARVLKAALDRRRAEASS